MRSNIIDKRHATDFL